jgi:hypothetical protein
MELLEFLFALGQGCGCLLEVLALTDLAGAAASGVKARKNQKARKQARKEGREPPPVSPWVWVFWVLLAVGVLLLIFLLWVRLR